MQLSKMAQVEDALGLDHDWLLRRAGYYEAPTDVEAIIAANPNLSPPIARAAIELFRMIKATPVVEAADRLTP